MKELIHLAKTNWKDIEKKHFLITKQCCDLVKMWKIFINKASRKQHPLMSKVVWETDLINK